MTINKTTKMNFSDYKMYFTKIVVIVIILIIEVNLVSSDAQIENNEVCGIKHTKVVSNIIIGSNATQNEYPWQVAVYNAKKKLICGGSLISEGIVLSAAHCFTGHAGEVFPKENYYIAGGKYYSDYEDERDHNAQYSEINAIHVPLRYKGISNLFEADIALIILSTPFNLSTNIQPVCIDFERDYDKLDDDYIGIATTWNDDLYQNDDNDQTKGLTEDYVSYIPYHVCYDESPNTFRSVITYDKFCGSYSNNDTSIWKITGGPVTFLDTVGNNERYFVRGILSAIPTTKYSGTNDTNLQIFTSVAKHIAFIRHVVTLK